MPRKKLSEIQGPEDLKDFSLEDLESLASQLRQRIIDVMSVNGGHLASNLGAVELSIALHKVFNSPQDKFIFDVSHQAYSHKLLTGRYHQFDSIRKYKGLSGFSNPQESPHDPFYAGHAGTALSLGLGIAKSRDLLQNEEYVIPILGDAALTCGLTLEALNNIPKDLKKFIVILNDNKMSISNNVGALSHMLSRMTDSPTYRADEESVSSKSLVSSAPFFEEFGLSYVGPIDGHDINALIDILEKAKDSPQPILLHVMTTKGKGLESATKNPISWHGCRPFDKETCTFLPVTSSKSTFPQVFGNHLLKMAEKDPYLVAVTPAMLSGSCLTNFAGRFPDRCIDVGIAEGHSVTFAGGLAHNPKLKVVSSLYATFSQRAFDNIFQDICLQQAPVVFALDRAGFSPADGSTHHGIYDIAFFNAMPNMVIAQPRNGQLLKELLESAVEWKRPTVIRYPNLSTSDEEKPVLKRQLGKGEVLSQGKHVAIIALGHMNQMAFDISEILRDENIHPTIIDPVFLKPLDSELLTSILSTHDHIVTLEEHSVNAGLGVIINNFIVKNEFHNVTVQNFGIPDQFIEQGSHKELLEEISLTPEKISLSILNHISNRVHPHLNIHSRVTL